MDFFESQDAANRSTRWLLVLFLLAVIGIVAVTNGLVYLLIQFQSMGIFHYTWDTVLQVSGAVLSVIILGSLYRVYSLKKGGEVIAAQLGGKLLLNGGETLQERRLENVVEEMAIASGTPVPPIYLYESDGINAFAAGYTPSDAVIGVTRGAIMNLNREQLQGVIAHEFSHILNGDMRLNIRLVGVLHGILMLSVIGRGLLETRGGRARKSSATAAILMIGLGLFLLGYIGKIFGDVIKAAVSRQREFLADASAVQFTRNPDGIAGALRRIGGYRVGSRLHFTGAEEFSHLYFSEGIRSNLNSWLATHPQLDERIKRILPGWDGRFIESVPVGVHEPDLAPGVSGFATTSGSEAVSASAISAIGAPGVGHIERAQSLLRQIPGKLKQASYDAFSARALVYMVLLADEDQVRKTQLGAIQEHADVFVRARLRELMEDNEVITPEMRLPLLELSLPILRQLGQEEFERFQSNVKNLVSLDGKMSLTEWALQTYLLHNLAQSRAVKPRRPYLDLETVAEDIRVLLSILAHSDSASAVAARQAFVEGRDLVELTGIELLPKEMLSLSKLDAAIERLQQVNPLKKPKLLKACAGMILSDGKVSPVEAELLRAFSDSLDCPMPPILKH